MEPRMPVVGQAVVYHDEVGNPHPALITAVWGASCVNLLFVSSNETELDPYGRQIKRESSCTHVGQTPVYGRNWRFEDEAPNPIVSPCRRNSFTCWDGDR